MVLRISDWISDVCSSDLMVLWGLVVQYSFGLVATFGAQCLAIIDQPGGPQRHRTNEMLGGALLATAAVTITGAASTYPLLLWLAVIGQCFVFSMFSVFGKRGGLIGFAGMLIMTLTLHSPLAPTQERQSVGWGKRGAVRV